MGKRRALANLFMLGVITVLVTTSRGLDAADTTAALLNAPLAKQRIYVWAEPGLGEKPAMELRFQIDTRDGTGVTLEGDPTIAADGEITFLFRDFNPLQFRITGSAVDGDDPNFKQLSDLLSKLGDLKKLLSGTAAATVARTEAVRECPEQDEFRATLQKVAQKLAKPEELKEKDLKDWISEAKGKKGAADTAEKIRNVAETVQKELTDVKGWLRQLEALARQGKWEDAACKFKVSDLSALLLISDGVDNFFSVQTQLAAQLNALAKQLDGFAQGVWLGDDYTFLRKKPTDEKQAIVTIEVKTVTVTIKDKLPDVKLESSDKLKESLTLRASRTVVWEAAAGIVYSGLKTHKYGTGPKEGDSSKTVVTNAGTEAADLSAAFMANAVFKGPFGRSLPMMLQFGVSLQKDIPALLVGLGFRLSASSNTVGIAGGFAGGWVKDLNHLAPGDEVKGTADIEADLKQVFRPSYYLSIQYQF